MRSSTTTPTTAAEAERYTGEHTRAGEVVLLPEVGPVPAPIADLVAALPPAHAGRLLALLREHLVQLWAEAQHRHHHGPPGAADPWSRCLQRGYRGDIVSSPQEVGTSMRPPAVASGYIYGGRHAVVKRNGDHADGRR